MSNRRHAERAEDELYAASQGLQRAAALVHDDEFAAWLRETNDDLQEQWGRWLDE